MRVICENDGCGYEGEPLHIPDPNDSDNSDAKGCLRAGCMSIAIVIVLSIIISSFVEDYLGFAIVGALLSGGATWFFRKKWGRKVYVCPECNPTGEYHNLSVFKVSSPAAQALRVRRARMSEEAHRYEDSDYRSTERQKYLWRRTNGQIRE